ncbi:LysR family transcriptional regulator, hydrogen peroxide-inducible genes activator [Loktanella sp. DSM 29012]|uniref:hydrogen peroxide-inducible genes activator n=1 Tax=Loktanella sp. DSM 29012 TaxID=1881056 RepID=UPI0008C1A24E|nr:hydrogen peroxide-inducible genes activator [Loktanella sp. DSM 29012]SEQ47837.1 LysR family transcriptional regulator, hydrogen peroxide-inducible genes activator [Loktanella sp. DSM 29012]
MSALTLKQLRYFEALAAQGHFGRAAAVVAISQPALSMQIKELEDSLGTLLFERSARQVRLTPFGEVFAPRAREILRAVDEVTDLARLTQGGALTRLRLGIIPTIAPYLLPRVIAALGQTHPGLDLRLRESVTQTLLDDLDAGRLDAAIVALPISEPALTEMTLLEEEFVLVRPRADADSPIPSPAALREMRLLLLEEGHCFRDQALSFCQMPDTQPKEMLDGSTLSTLVQMVGSGIGVTLIPDMAVAVETASAPVSIARFPGSQPRRTVGMVWRQSSALGAALTQVGQTLRDAARIDPA